MKRLLILSFALAAGAAWAARSSFNLFVWEPIAFAMDGEAARAGMAELEAANDGAFMAMKKWYPGFSARVMEVFAFVATAKLETYHVPPVSLGFYDDGWKAEDKLNFASSSFAGEVNSVRKAVSEQMNEIFGRQGLGDYGYKYLYCEHNPASTADFCQSDYSEEWIFLRRLFTRPSFVRAICPAATQYALWNLNWNADQANVIDAYFKELDRVLGLYENGGVWSEDIVGKIDSDLSRSFVGALDRRYLDGGPALMLAMKDCAAQIHAAFKTLRPASDARSTAAIADILKFKPVPISGGYSVGLSSAILTVGDILRLTRHFGVDNLRPPESQETELTIDDAIRLTINLSQLDPVYSYRLLNLPEFRMLAKRKESVVMDRERVIVVSQDYIRYGLEGLQKYWAYPEDYSNPNETDGGSYEQVSTYIVVREKK